MPEKKPKSPKVAQQKVLQNTRRKMHIDIEVPEEGTKVINAKGRQQTSQIPVVKKRGGPSLATKRNDAVITKQVQRELEQSDDEEKDLLKTPLKSRPDLDRGKKVTPSRRSRGYLPDSKGSPASVKSSSSTSPYFLRSKGTSDISSSPEELVLISERTRKSKSLDNAQKRNLPEPDKLIQKSPVNRRKMDSRKIPVWKTMNASSLNKSDESPKNVMVDKLLEPGIKKVRKTVRKSMTMNGPVSKDMFPDHVTLSHRVPRLSLIRVKVSEVEMESPESIMGKAPKVGTSRKKKKVPTATLR